MMIHGLITPPVRLVAGLALALSSALGPGDLLWEDQVDKSGQADLAEEVAYAGGRLFVAGSVTPTGQQCDLVTGNCDFYVKAYEAASGVMLWENRVDMAGGIDDAVAIAVSNGRVFAAGPVGGDTSCNLNDSTGNCDFYVRAYNAATGAVLWQDRHDEAGGFDYAVDIAVSQGVVVASGLVQNAAGNFDFFVRAYNGANGAVLWEDQLDRAGGSEVARMTAMRGTWAAVVGSVAGDATCVQYPFSGNCDFYVRVYNATNGAVAWEDQVDPAGGFDQAFDVAIGANQVFVAGVVAADTSCDYYSSTGDCDFFVRAYSPTSAVQWTQQIDTAGGADTAYGLAVSNGRVFAAGFSTNAAGNLDFVVRAFGSLTGTLLWENALDRAGSTDYAYDVVVANGQVFAGGVGTNTTSFDFLVRAYDARTGVLRWEDQVDKGGSVGLALSLAVGGGQLFAAGFDNNPAGNPDFLVRSYDVQ